MKISEMIRILQEIQATEGDMDVYNHNAETIDMETGNIISHYNRYRGCVEYEVFGDNKVGRVLLQSHLEDSNNKLIGRCLIID